MDKAEFTNEFDNEVAAPLHSRGFRSAGKSLFLIEGATCLSLIRLGGRLARIGAVTHILCFRHTFLRNLEEVLPDGFERQVFSYPYKLALADFADLANPPRYRSSNLDFAFDELRFEPAVAPNVRAELRNLKSLLLDRAVPWALSLSPERAANEIRTNGRDEWCERLWLEDYARNAGA